MSTKITSSEIATLINTSNKILNKGLVNTEFQYLYNMYRTYLIDGTKRFFKISAQYWDKPYQPIDFTLDEVVFDLDPYRDYKITIDILKHMKSNPYELIRFMLEVSERLEQNTEGKLKIKWRDGKWRLVRINK